MNSCRYRAPLFFVACFTSFMIAETSMRQAPQIFTAGSLPSRHCLLIELMWLFFGSAPSGKLNHQRQNLLMSHKSSIGYPFGSLKRVPALSLTAHATFDAIAQVRHRGYCLRYGSALVVLFNCAIRLSKCKDGLDLCGLGDSC